MRQSFSHSRIPGNQVLVGGLVACFGLVLRRENLSRNEALVAAMETVEVKKVEHTGETRWILY